MADFIAINEIEDYIDKRINSLNINITDQADAIIKYMQGGVQEFISDGVFTVPAHVKKIRVDAVGGGAGGGAGGGRYEHNDYNYGGASGGGGGAGEYVTNKILNVTPNSSITVSVGKGGSGGVYVLNQANLHAANGMNGTSTTVNGITIARGGEPGQGGCGSSTSGGSNRAYVGNFGANYGTGMTNGYTNGIGGIGGFSGYSSYGRGGNGGNAGYKNSNASDGYDGKDGSNGWVRISWEMGY